MEEGSNNSTVPVKTEKVVPAENLLFQEELKTNLMRIEDLALSMWYRITLCFP